MLLWCYDVILQNLQSVISTVIEHFLRTLWGNNYQRLGKLHLWKDLVIDVIQWSQGHEARKEMRADFLCDTRAYITQKPRPRTHMLYCRYVTTLQRLFTSGTVDNVKKDIVTIKSIWSRQMNGRFAVFPHERRKREGKSGRSEHEL